MSRFAPSLRFESVLSLLCAVAVAGCADASRELTALCRTPEPQTLAIDQRVVHDGAWSYFGDPRSIAQGDRIFTGCVGVDRGIVVEQFDRRTGKAFHAHLHRNNELDDHDNPSVVVWRRRVYAFYAPHSGKVFPKDRRMELHYRASRAELDLRRGFGSERHVWTNTPGGLGFTYPNPVPTADKLWLFWRGGDWNPTFSYTRDGRTWAKARTLVRGPSGQRPYAKYVAGPDGSIHVILSDAHPRSYRTSLYYVRYKATRFYDAAGRRIGTMRDLPLRTSRLDRIYGFRAAGGRAWPQDIAVGPDGRPVVVYTRRRGGPDGTDTFFYARPRGAGWTSHRIVGAGRGGKTFTNGGVTLHNARPSWVVLSRTIGRRNEIELWRTPDDGASWLAPFPITSRSAVHNIRPVIPRGLTDSTRLVVFYVHGMADSFRRFRTVIRMGAGPVPAELPEPVATPAQG